MASLTATPAEPIVGEAVLINGDGFADGGKVTLTIDEEGFSSEIVADASGSFGTTDVADHATTVLTSNNSNPAVNDTYNIAGRTYRFVDTLSQVDDVKRGADANATLANLKKTINLTGTVGTEYFTGQTIHASVFAGDLDAAQHKLKLHAKTGGTAGNTLATTAGTGATLSAPGATFNSGTPGSASTGVSPIIWHPAHEGTFHAKATDGTNTVELSIRVWRS